MIKILGLLLLTFLVSCAGKNAPSTKAQFVLGFASGTSTTGGLMIYAKRVDGPEVFALPLNDQYAGDNVNLVIPKGTYDFLAVGWSGHGTFDILQGDNYCGEFLNVPVDGDAVTIPMTLSNANCSNIVELFPDGLTASTWSSTSFASPTVSFCKHFHSVKPAGPNDINTFSCSGDDAADVNSFQFELAGIDVATGAAGTGLLSTCFTGTPTVSLPFGGANAKYPINTRIIGYKTTDCTHSYDGQYGEPVEAEYVFPDGLANNHSQLIGVDPYFSTVSVSAPDVIVDGSAIYLIGNTQGAGWTSFMELAASPTKSEMPTAWCDNGSVTCVINDPIERADISLGYDEAIHIMPNESGNSATPLAHTLPIYGLTSGNCVSVMSGGTYSSGGTGINDVTVTYGSCGACGSDSGGDYCMVTLNFPASCSTDRVTAWPGTGDRSICSNVANAFTFESTTTGKLRFFPPFGPGSGDAWSFLNLREPFADVVGLSSKLKNSHIQNQDDGDSDWVEEGIFEEILKEMGPEGFGGIFSRAGYSSCMAIDSAVTGGGEITAYGIDRWEKVPIRVVAKEGTKARQKWVPHGNNGNYDIRVEIWDDDPSPSVKMRVYEFDCYDNLTTINSSTPTNTSQGYFWENWSGTDPFGGTHNEVFSGFYVAGTNLSGATAVNSTLQYAWVEDGTYNGEAYEERGVSMFAISPGATPYMYAGKIEYGFHNYYDDMASQQVEEKSLEKSAYKLDLSNNKVVAYQVQARNKDVASAVSDPAVPDPGTCSNGDYYGTSSSCTGNSGTWNAFANDDNVQWTGNAALATQVASSQRCGDTSSYSAYFGSYSNCGGLTPISIYSIFTTHFAGATAGYFPAFLSSGSDTDASTRLSFWVPGKLVAYDYDAICSIVSPGTGVLTTLECELHGME